MDFLHALAKLGYLSDAGYATDVAVSSDGGVVAVVTESARGAIYLYVVERSGAVSAVTWEPSEGLRFRWPSVCALEAACWVRFQSAQAGGDGWAAWKALALRVGEGAWRGFEVDRIVPPLTVVSDRGVRINDRGETEVNPFEFGPGGWAPRYSAQGIGCFAIDTWHGADQLRERWAVEPNFYARDMTDDGEWVVGSELVGPVTTFLIHARTRERYAVLRGLAYEPRVAWDGARVWVVAGGENGELRRGSWTLDELRALRVGGGGIVPEVTIVDWVKSTTAPARVGYAYRTTAVASAEQLIRPEGASEWLRAPIAVADRGGFGAFQIDQPGRYEIALEARAPDGQVVRTTTRRVVEVVAAPVPPVATIPPDEWDRLRSIGVDVLAAVALAAEVVGRVGWVAPEHAALSPRWLTRYQDLRLRNGLTPDQAVEAIVREMTDAVVRRVRGEA